MLSTVVRLSYQILPGWDRGRGGTATRYQVLAFCRVFGLGYDRPVHYPRRCVKSTVSLGHGATSGQVVAKSIRSRCWKVLPWKSWCHLRKVRRGYLADVSDGIMKTLQKKVSSLFGRRLDSLTTTPISLLSKHKAFAATPASKLQAKPAREGWHFAANCHPC